MYILSRIKQRRQSGDTIVEVLIVIAIISTVLAGAYVVSSRSTTSLQNSQERATGQHLLQSQIEQIRTALNTDSGGTVIADIRKSDKFCMNLGAVVTPYSDTACTDSGLYKISITKATEPDAYKFSVTWDALGGVTNNQEMYYRVYSGDSISLWKPTEESTVPPVIPGCPTSISATATVDANKYSIVNLSGYAAVDATRYDILRDGNVVGSTTNTSYVDTTVTYARSYIYSVRPWNDVTPVAGSCPTKVATTPTPTYVTLYQCLYGYGYYSSVSADCNTWYRGVWRTAVANIIALDSPVLPRNAVLLSRYGTKEYDCIQSTTIGCVFDYADVAWPVGSTFPLTGMWSAYERVSNLGYGVEPGRGDGSIKMLRCYDPRYGDYFTWRGPGLQPGDNSILWGDLIWGDTCTPGEWFNQRAQFNDNATNLYFIPVPPAPGYAN